MAWDEALTGIDMVSVLDPALPEVAAVAASAREIVTRLGAKPYLARLEAILQGDLEPRPVTTAARPPEPKVLAADSASPR